MARNRHRPEIEIGLTALVIHAEPGQTLEFDEIAEVCGCSRSAISQIAVKALKNFKYRLWLRGIQLNDLVEN